MADGKVSGEFNISNSVRLTGRCSCTHPVQPLPGCITLQGSGGFLRFRNHLPISGLYTVEPPITDPPRGGYPRYNVLRIHSCNALATSEKRTLPNSGQRTKSSCRTALHHTFLPLNSGHPEATPQKLQLCLRSGDVNLHT